MRAGRSTVWLAAHWPALAQGTAAEAAVLLDRFKASDFKPEEISNVEGRLDALQASMQTQPAGQAARQILDAPSANTVSMVQQRLYALGHNDVVVTGIADVTTEQAIRVELAKFGVDHADPHPRMYRFYEELSQLIR